MTAEAVSAPNKQRVLWITTALGFSAGLPYSLLVGTVSAWLIGADVNFSTIGALSWIGLFYAFKFIWAPAFDWLVPPFANTVGRRRAWIMLCQVVIALCLFGMTLFDPRTSILAFAGFAVLAAFASASQDIVIDAWRIEIADTPEQLDSITVRYQMGYRLATIVGGAIALLLADIWATPADGAAGWPPIFVFMAFLMICAIGATLAAPSPVLAPRKQEDTEPHPETTRMRRQAAVPVAIGWAVAGVAILGLMFYTLADPSAAALQNNFTPWILALTIGAPLAVSYWLAHKPGVMDMNGGSSKHIADILFQRVLAPLTDIVKRYWLWALPILALAMTYRIADSIWGSYAYAFYLGVLEHSNSDVAVASKMVGVFMTLGGIALGGVALKYIGRMPSLIVGGVLAAITNLLYMDLARGGHWADAFLRATGIGALFDWALRGFVGAIQSTGATIFDGVSLGDALNRLTAVIAMENLAGGFASAVHIAWLSSIVNKSYAAVQYALLSSLALLVGVIFRPRIGAYVDGACTVTLGRETCPRSELTDAQIHTLVADYAVRFADVFVFATWIGLLAVALAGVEWWRQSKYETDGPSVG